MVKRKIKTSPGKKSKKRIKKSKNDIEALKEKHQKEKEKLLAETTEAKEQMSQKIADTKLNLIKEIDKTGIKIAASALVIALISACSLLLLAFGQNQAPISVILTASALVLLGSIIIVSLANDALYVRQSFIPTSVIGGILLGFLSLVGTGGPYSNGDWLFTSITGAVLGAILFVVIAYASYGRLREMGNKLSFLRASVLSLIFFVVCIIGITPLSKYHNLNQIERDKKVVEMLEITNDANGIEILLRAENVSKHRYIKQVLCFIWPEQDLAEAEETQTWKKLSIKCTEGKKQWYKAKLNFPPVLTTLASDKLRFKEQKEVILFFNHAWKDHETTKEIVFSDPNSHSL